MWKLKSTKSFLLLLVLSFCALSAFAQEDSPELEELQVMATKLSSKSNSSSNSSKTSTKNYSSESKSVSSSNNNLTQSDLESMNPFELLDLLEMKLSQAEASLQEAVSSSKNLEDELFNTKLELENSKATLESLKKALISNKNDTSYVISELGLLYERVKSLNESLASYTKMQRRFRTVSHIELGVGVGCLALGMLPIWNDSQQNIKNLLLGIGGASTAAGVAGFVLTIKF